MNSGRSFDTPSPQNEPPSIFIQYDSIDFIKTFAGLTLLPQNHGKNIRFEELSRRAITNFNQNKPNIPVTKLQTFLDENYPSHYLEDPATNLFTDLVTFYGGDYIIFPGITEGGNYVLSKLLISIYNWPNSGISEEFRSNCKHASLLILNLSNSIAKRLGYNRYTLEEVEDNLISFPTIAQLGNLKLAVTFTEEEIHQLLLENRIAPEALALFLLNMNDLDLANEHLEDESALLIKPIIHYNGEYIVASPATLSYALVDFIQSQANLTGIQQLLDNAYHNVIWNYTQLHLRQLGFTSTAIEFPAIPENTNADIRESIYRFDDDKLAFIQYVGGGEPYQERKQQIINETLAQPEFAGHQFIDITLISSMGRDLFFMSDLTDNSLSIVMPIHDLETLVKLKEHTAYDLWKFAKARDSQIPDSNMFGVSFLDIFKVYKENDDSFYVSDHSSGFVLHVEPGYGSSLYQEAKLLTDEHSIQRLIKGRLANIQVERKDKFAPIYYSIDELSGGDLNFAVEGFPQPIWVSPSKSSFTIPVAVRSLYYEMADAIAYWLWQCQEHVYKDLTVLGTTPITFIFEFDQEERFNKIERNFDRDPELANHFAVTSEENSISMSIPPSIIPYLYGADNEGERELTRQLLHGLNQILNTKQFPPIEAERINQILEQAAPSGVKKKIFILDGSDNLLLDPSHLEEHRYLQSYDVNVVLNSLVPGLGHLCPPVGDITEKAAKTKLTRDVVMRVLLPKLQATISQYQHEPLLQRLIGLNESLIHQREELRIKTPTRIACFVSVEQQTNDLQENLAKLNQTTLAVRCLIEHLAAEPSTGKKTVSITAVDELIAVMNAIIDWGSMGDQIEFDLFEIDMGILPSGRIGSNKQLFKEIFDPYHSSKSKENVSNAIETFEQAFLQLNPIVGINVPENLDKAFIEEFKISFNRICQFINSLVIIAYDQATASASLSKCDLFIQINQHDNTFTQEEFDHAIEYLCLVNRGKAHKIPKGFDGIDISPWRFNRRLSLLRRPLVVVDNPKAPDNPTLYWGFRQLLASKRNLSDQCTTNRLRVSEDGPVQKMLGKLAQRNGNQLVQSVLKQVGSDELIVDSEVPINPKSALKHNKDIGDVDVLVIDTTTKVLYSLECKSMAPSRNIKEMVEEVSKLFGSNSKKGWIEKHVERDTWLKNNLDLIGVKYNLDLLNYTVRSFFITREDMLAPYLKTKKTALPFVTLYNLKEDGIKALK